MKTKIILGSMAAFLCLGCESGTSPNPSAHEIVTEKIVGKTWHPVSDQFEPGMEISGLLITDNMNLRQPCDHDGSTVFHKDGTYIADEGPAKCLDDSPQTVEGTWILNEENTQLTMTPKDGEPATFELEAITDTSLYLSIAGNLTEHKQVFGFSMN
jgi:hypothetical protein